MRNKSKNSKEQYKRYFLDTVNVFYEDRPVLKKIKFSDNLFHGSLVLWLFLFVTYYFIRTITPFEGICPAHARCLVYVRCDKNYEYINERCQLKQSAIEQVEAFALDGIFNLQYQYGN